MTHISHKKPDMKAVTHISRREAWGKILPERGLRDQRLEFGGPLAFLFFSSRILAAPILLAIARSAKRHGFVPSAVGSDDASFCSTLIVLFHTHRSVPHSSFCSTASFFSIFGVRRRLGGFVSCSPHSACAIVLFRSIWGLCLQGCWAAWASGAAWLVFVRPSCPLGKNMSCCMSILGHCWNSYSVMAKVTLDRRWVYISVASLAANLRS